MKRKHKETLALGSEQPSAGVTSSEGKLHWKEATLSWSPSVHPVLRGHALGGHWAGHADSSPPHSGLHHLGAPQCQSLEGWRRWAWRAQDTASGGLFKILTCNNSGFKGPVLCVTAEVAVPHRGSKFCLPILLSVSCQARNQPHSCWLCNSSQEKRHSR